MSQPWGTTNKPDTCLWCGRRLRHQLKRVLEEWHYVYVTDENGKKVKEEKGGAYKDGSFCGLSCGYAFGVALANGGSRLRPRVRNENTP